MPITPPAEIALVGCGLVGRGWAILFARARLRVRLFDAAPQLRGSVLAEIKSDVQSLESLGPLKDGAGLLSRLTLCSSLEEAATDADYVQESIFEDASAKRAVFTQIAEVARKDAILASSCSTIPPDRFLLSIPNAERCIVAHPFNPPHVIPIVEILGSSATSETTIEATRHLMASLGQRPVVLRKPITGYVVNRLQAAVISEALHLVAEDVVSPRDLDACMKYGLGRRWAFMGPFETMDLNSTGGVKEYVSRYYERAYRAICSDMDIGRPWSATAVERVEAWRRQACPDEAALRKRRIWRDAVLARLASFLEKEAGGDPID